MKDVSLGRLGLLRHAEGVHYVPIGWPFFVALWFLFAMLVAMVQIGILQFAFERMGVSRRYMLLLLAGSLLGSYINIPIASFPPERVVSGRVVEFLGSSYRIPVVQDWPGTVLAVNVGGAVIPVVLSIYLLFKHRFPGNAVLATGIVTLAVHWMARPVPGVGIVVPMFIPPLVTAIVALSLSRYHAAPLAYIAGSLGTLIGADLLNLGHLAGVGAPVASIGGAGKFDGIFLTGLAAMFIAGFFGKSRPRTAAN
jgi:uncharacterized membrane protein